MNEIAAGIIVAALAVGVFGVCVVITTAVLFVMDAARATERHGRGCRRTPAVQGGDQSRPAEPASDVLFRERVSRGWVGM